MEESGCRLALGLLECQLEWMAGSSSTGVYLRRAGRHCDPTRTAHVPRPYRRYCAGTYPSGTARA